MGFGNEAYSRQELVVKTIDKIKKDDPQCIKQVDKFGFFDNIIYITDTYNDFISGLKAKVKVIWIPSRSIQIVKEFLNRDDISLILEVLGKNILLTNDSSNKETEDFLFGK